MKGDSSQYQCIKHKLYPEFGTTLNEVPILDIDMKALKTTIEECSPGDLNLYFTPNADHLRLLEYRNSAFAEAYRRASAIVCDSRIVRLISRLTPGSSVKNVTPGSDLTKELFLSDWFTSKRISILGSSPVDVELLKRKFSAIHLSQYAPPFGFEAFESESTRCIDFVTQSNPDYILIALGCPKSEILSIKILDSLEKSNSNVRAIFCIGASIDFLTGKQRRAPKIVQSLSLEWAYRLLTNFSRLWRRYLSDGIWIMKFSFKRFFKYAHNI